MCARSRRRSSICWPCCVSVASLSDSLRYPLPARTRALDYLANRRRDLSDELRYQLTQVLEGYIGRFDEGAARADVALGLFMTLAV